MSQLPVALLVVAKAPVPGRAKTRIAAAVGDRVAARIAAAALLDTLDTVAAVPVPTRTVALAGELDAAVGADEIRDRLSAFTVIDQRGDGFGDRLANAHADAAGPYPVLQIGMDTPQITTDLLTRCATQLLAGTAVLGFARDGGWWTLGLHSAAVAECLRNIPVSQPSTGALTLKALQDTGIDVTLVEQLTDVDTVDQIAAVRDACPPGSRFALAARAAGW